MRLRVHLPVGRAPLRMVPVEVAVHNVSHRLLCYFAAELGDQRDHRRRFRVRVDYQQIVGVLEDRGVAVQHCRWFGDRRIDPIRDLLNVKERR